MSKLDFFIVGTQKGCTTALWQYLRVQPRLQLSQLKELHFFDDERLDWRRPSYERLHAPFNFTIANLGRGEATPIYMYWPKSIERIYRYNPAAKIIATLRHPSFRAFSHWQMEYDRGNECLPFPEAIGESGRQRVRNAPNGAHRIFSYVERGFYAGQIRRLKQLFPDDQLLFLTTDQIWANPGASLATICRFLGVPNLQRHDNYQFSAADARPHNALFERSRKLLDQIYRRDIINTQRTTGLDLSHWLSDAYAEVTPYRRP
ncbi:MAG: sulfotransferase [Sphingomonadaceae bacterium]|nr:sulfotransferase [Sphingomonadaceae bacterium]